jgi:hypothetical protein
VWSWIFGAVLTILAILGNGGPGGGDSDFVDLHMLGVGLTLVGLSAVALCLVVTVLTSRAPGMDLMDAPAFSWAALVGGFAIVVTFPVALGSIVYSYLLHTYGVPAAGEQDMAMPISVFPDWLFGQPTTLVMVVLAVGFLAEVAPVVFKVRQPLREAVLVGLGVMTVAALTGITQTQHVLDLDGFRVRFHHGHAVRYQGGIGGIHVPLNKSIAAWDATLKADLTCLGHWHQFSWGRSGRYVSNGSVIGHSAYAVRIKAAYEPPCQACVVIDHERHETTKAFPLFCDRDLRAKKNGRD